ncbi:MAG: hypothetical protein SFU86_18625 [Pirellulaceae bacterium]|nr:hypothetical protein [Pirellulaceae bacterium]
MNIFLKVTLLSVFAAVGIAIAIALALQKPPVATDSLPLRPVTAGEAVPTPTAAPLAPAIAPYRDPVAYQQMQDLEATIQRAQDSAQRQQLSIQQAITKIQDQLAAAEDDEQPAAVPPTAAPPAIAPPPAAGPLPAPTKIQAEGDGLLSIEVQNEDIRQVLALLSKQQEGLNILAGKSVTGTVTASLNNVDFDTALAAILKSTGFVSRREGNILYVGSPADFVEIDQTQDRIVSRVYRPNYIKAADLQSLITPMLTPEIGKVTVSAPSGVDIPPDQTKSGGVDFAGIDVVIVRDYEAVLHEVDQLFEEVDIKPKQVAIEAMILSVKLVDQYKFGVNFDVLKNQNNIRFVAGSPLAGLSSIDPTTGGLKFGFLDSSLATFVSCLETIGDTNVIASPRLTCLNKQRAEIQIGDQLGYISTAVTENSATQTVNFLDTGTLLRIRPHISSDGLVRLEVHPELSTGTVTVQSGFTLPNKSVTQVTTNVMCPDGCTVVIGGLIREDLKTNASQIPVLGDLPYFGWLFRDKTEGVDRVELIVLITPRIVSEPAMAQEGQKYGNVFTERQSVYFDKMSPIAKRNYALHYFRLARSAFNAGDMNAAMKHVNLSIQHDPLNRDAIVLRDEIVTAGGFENESIRQHLRQGFHSHPRRKPDYSKQGAPWKDPPAFGSGPEVISSDDPGQPGAIRTLEPVPAGTKPPTIAPVTIPEPLSTVPEAIAP